MARIADIKDAALRLGLEEADRLIDAGEYRKSVEKTADTYLLAVKDRPELVPKLPPGFGPGTGFGFGGGASRALSGNQPIGQPAGQAAGGGGPGLFGFGGGFNPAFLAMMRNAWPRGLGLQIAFDEDNKPTKTFEKERFSLSEAVTYFEFALDFIARNQAKD
jgi:hypothetical protein